jgi:uncharacterized protein YecA (UPF0149 family)
VSGPRSNERKDAIGRKASKNGGTGKRFLKWIAEHGKDRFIPSKGPITRKTPKVGRNDPCSCGSGRKWKRCCMKDGA